MTVPVLPGLASLAGRYQAFVLDLWGVVHDGGTPYPGAIDCLEELKRAGRRVALLSNAPRRSSVVVDAMTAMGIDRDFYGVVLTSGEVVHEELKSHRDPWFAALGRLCYHLGPDRDRSVAEGTGIAIVPSPAGAEFVLNTGPVTFEDTLEDYRDVLAEAAGRELPMICANPDLEVIREGRRVICAGLIARAYEEIGGEVVYRGKPYADVFLRVMAMLGIRDLGSAVSVGDSLRTDLAGARAAGIDSIFVAGGIHAAELGIEEGTAPDAEAVSALCERAGESPVAAVGAFVW